MLRKLLFALTSVVALAAVALQPAKVEAAGGNGEYRVAAQFQRIGLQNTGKSVYRERMRGTMLQQKFKVQVEALAPNTSYQVRLNGNLVANLTTNAFGTAEIEFATLIPDNNPGDEDPPIPTDFPRIPVGATITVGPLTGTFVRI